MKINTIGSNQTQLTLGDGTVIFFSYDTPVAAWVFGRGYLRTNKFWSKTTSGHINKWLDRMGTGTVTEVSQEDIYSLVNGVRS